MGIKIYDLDSDEETKESKKRRTKERIAKEEKSFTDRTGSDANAEANFDRAVEKLLGEGSKISDADRARAEKSYIELNDGGMAMSGRGKPVRTF
jgi:glutamate formiminotransferase